MGVSKKDIQKEMEKWAHNEQGLYYKVIEDKAIRATLPALMTMMTIVASVIIAVVGQKEETENLILAIVFIFCGMVWRLLNEIQRGIVREKIYEKKKERRISLRHVKNTSHFRIS